MSGVPNVFGSATSSIPLSQLDVNFNTPLYIGNTSVGLGNTVTSFGNVTLTNTTITVGNVTTDLTVHGLTVGQGGGSVSTNTAVGASALSSNTSGLQNTALGNLALTTNTASSGNTGLGYGSLNINDGGNYNTAVGRSSLGSNTTGNNSVAVGYQALVFNTASNNTAVGYQALYGVSDTGNNTALGYSAGSDLTSGANYNLMLGPNTRSIASNANTQIVMGVNPSGTITGKGGNTFFVYANNSAGQATGGSYYNGANSSSWSTTSDARIKENVVTIADGLTPILALRPVSFDYIVSKQKDVSFIAQEYQTVFPEQVVTHSATKEEAEVAGTDTIFGLQKNLDPYLVRAIQQLNALVTAQATEITALKAKVGI